METYPVVVGCMNCQGSSELTIAKGMPLADALRADIPDCPQCGVPFMKPRRSNSMVRSFTRQYSVRYLK